MAIQVWNGSEYVGAELARFGASGTLKEASIWDGTQYVKVWPSSSYPASGEWSLDGQNFSAEVAVSHTIAEDGEYALTLDGYAGGDLFSLAIWGPWGTTTDGSGGNTQSTFTITRTLATGDIVNFGTNVRVRSASGAWSITKL